jgi:hypothetical protein
MSEDQTQQPSEPTNLLGGESTTTVEASDSLTTQAGVNDNPIVNGDVEGSAMPEWKQSLAEDLRNDPTIQTTPTVEALAKQLVHAQKAVGKDKVVLPGKHGTEDDWAQVFKKLGRPENGEGYTLPEEGFTDSEKQMVREMALKNNLLPGQLEGVLGWVKDVASSRVTEVQNGQKEHMAKQQEILKKEFGDAYDHRLNLAKTVIEKVGGEEMLAKMRQMPELNQNAEFVKLLSKVGEQFLAEDKVDLGPRMEAGMTPGNAQSEIEQIMGNYESPYYNESHPAHKRVVERVQELYKMVLAN